MADQTLNQQLAKPVHIQRLERSLRLEPFLDQVNNVLRRDGDDGDSDSSDTPLSSSVNINDGIRVLHGVPVPKSERIASKCRLYNFDQVGKERAWLKEVLLSDSSSSDSGAETYGEESINQLLYLHKLRKKYQVKFYDNPKNRQFMYYSAGLLSKKDIYPEHKLSVLKGQLPKTSGREKKEKATRQSRKKAKEEERESDMKLAAVKTELGTSSGSILESKDTSEVSVRLTAATIKKEPVDLAESADFSFDSDGDEPDGMGGLFRNVIESKGGEVQSPSPGPSMSPSPLTPSPHPSPKGRKKKDRIKKEKGEKKGKSKKEKGPPSVKALVAQRRKLWLLICKKEISKASKARVNNHKEELVSCKRAATGCMRVCRLRAMQSQKAMKDIVWRAKRLTREMQSYWKRYDRVEKVQRRQAEKEAEEQRKLDVELMEARRQQRKLNFLITQTELYAHFMAKKLGNPDAAAQQDMILSNLDEEVNPQLAYLDDYDSQLVKQRVMSTVNTAFHAHQQQTQQFDREVGTGTFSSTETTPQTRPEHAQPSMFHGSLKTYQLKGMNWIANLYDEGINGILADEMGLGKTVQSIAFLAHIAERYGIWGPFLVISPASTLHNWQQELARFVPDFKVIPYWGSPQERKILRKFWDTRNLHTREASFHVVVTSYQLIVTDYKYFNRINWQYMVLDEAQAIKSSSSTRWKMLLAFNCRNRLLLSGTPIQNSMAELWALLHFIMPTLFDSHEEFNEWFSKDIESHAENKTGIDEKHLSRLHMILKPFMLRRVKKDVENELSDKIEIMMYCPLTNRQRMLYQALKRKISIDDLLYSGGSSATAQTATTTLMNLVMQFRKVCNHPELFERREAKSPYFFQPDPYILPKFLFREGLLRTAVPSKRHLLYGRFSIWEPEHVHSSIFHQEDRHQEGAHAMVNSFASFSRLIDLSPSDLYCIMNAGELPSLKYGRNVLEVERRLHHSNLWDHPVKPHLLIQPFHALSPSSVESSSVLPFLVFTSAVGLGYAHLDHQLLSMSETIEHRLLRSRKAKVGYLPEFPFHPRPSQTLPSVWTNAPGLLSLSVLRVSCRGTSLLCSDRSAAYWTQNMKRAQSEEGDSLILYGSANCVTAKYSMFSPSYSGGLAATRPLQGWSNVVLPDKETLISDAGKLQVLDTLLRRLKSEGHRVLIYSQMTRIIDLLEEYMAHRKWTYMRLDGSSKISDRRDMVADFQTRSDIFVFLLSTRAGGLGINLTAADTVIFYDSDWNPTVDQQAMDRAHRLGQTKQVTVYRLICKGTIEERILQRAREKSKIQKMVISGGSFKPDTLKPTEVVSLLLDDEEIERKYRQRQAEKKQQEVEREAERKRKHMGGPASIPDSKRACLGSATPTEYTPAASPTLTESSQCGFRFDETSNDGSLVVDDGGAVDSSGVGRFTPLISGRQRQRPNRGSGRRGRPPGSGKRSRAMASGGTGREPVKSAVDSEVGFLSPEPSRLTDTPAVAGEEIPSTSQDLSTSPAIKRRPGRPRLRPVGPAHQGSRSRKSSSGDGGLPKKIRRGAPTGPRVIKPLPVPIGATKSTDGSSRVSGTQTSSSPSSANTRSTSQGCYGALSP